MNDRPLDPQRPHAADPGGALLVPTKDAAGDAVFRQGDVAGTRKTSPERMDRPTLAPQREVDGREPRISTEQEINGVGKMWNHYSSIVVFFSGPDCFAEGRLQCIHASLPGIMLGSAAFTSYQAIGKKDNKIEVYLSSVQNRE